VFGIVRVYFRDRGFGFITPLPFTGQRELYFHVCDVPGHVEFNPGDGVAFKTKRNRRSNKAVGVQAAEVDSAQRADMVRMIEKMRGEF